MFPIRSNMYALAAAVLVTATVATCADAGWVTIKNDTNKALVVQEVTFVNGKPVRGETNEVARGRVVPRVSEHRR